MLFDLGDTLWYRESQESWERLEEASNQHAVNLLRQHIHSSALPGLDDRALGHALRRAFDAQVRATIRGKPLLEPDAAQAVACVLRKWGFDEANHALCEALFEALRVRIPNSRPLFPDALATLAELRRRGYLLGIVTNRLWGGKPFHEDLQSIGLLDYFSFKHIAISGDLGLRKPNPQIFEHVLKSFDATPQETAMVGDSLSADILGAQPLGIYAIWKPKPWLSAWAREQAASRPALPGAALRPTSQTDFPGEDTADTQLAEPLEIPDEPPGEILLSDDDYILARANTSRDYLARFRRGEIRPDRIIAQLTELLDIFQGVGTP